jgi:transposase-like protein
MDSSKTPPTAGTDYPTTWVEFLDWFHSEQACRDYLERLRWADGLICPKCSEVSHVERMSRGRLICRGCKHQTTVTAGTVFDKTRTELRVWFAAIWYITNQKHGVSALGLQRVLGLGSYETAWAMLHRLRRAMVRPDRELLHGEVEIDETFLALTGKETPILATGRKNNTTKVLVVIAVEMLQPKGFGRIRIRQIAKGDHEHLMPFIEESIRVGAIIHSDGSTAYRKLEDAGYKHRRSVHLGSDIPAHESMPGVHRVASLLQRWMMGTHHGAVQPKHLDYYLDEFVFRFNRRTSRSRGLLFYRLIQQAVLTEPVTYAKIAGTPDESEQ